MNMKTLAENIHVSPSTYRAWEYGRAIQGPEPYLALAKALGISLIELMSGVKGEPLSSGEKLLRCEDYIREVRHDLLSRS